PASPEEAQAALRRALSRYNTGDARRGVANGYVGRVVKASAELIPALAPAGAVGDESAAASQPSPAWDVFGETHSHAPFVIRPTSSDGAQP
ncbi:MAG TPA: conjugal transfer protein, partial [Phenylobacterium sp.]|nr:conjugal transfer protein [Phenylobacterium sp.]